MKSWKTSKKKKTREPNELTCKFHKTSKIQKTQIYQYTAAGLLCCFATLFPLNHHPHAIGQPVCQSFGIGTLVSVSQSVCPW